MIHHKSGSDKSEPIVFVVLILFLLLFITVVNIGAHSGCCSWHGGVCSYQCPCGGIGYRCCDGTPLSDKCAPYYSQCSDCVPTPTPTPAPTPNRPTNTPSIPSGPSPGDTGSSYKFSTYATDPNGDKVQYRFDWGDGRYSSWSSLKSSGSSVSKSHFWDKAGTYYVRAQAKDEHGATSSWSSAKTVTISTPSTLTADTNSGDTDGDGLGDGGDVTIETPYPSFDSDRRYSDDWKYDEEDSNRPDYYEDKHDDYYEDYYVRHYVIRRMIISLFILGFIIWLFFGRS